MHSIYSTNIQNDDPNLLWLIYVYNSVVQTLWLASAKIKNVFEVHMAGSS